MTTLYDNDDRKILESLQRSVAKALDRKRRLGQYAVVWKDGEVSYIGPNPPIETACTATEPKTSQHAARPI
ncbi:hypothetical protein ERE07_03475 [Allopusillimonas ginsengisoli]|nr:hypothetical protein ERE07_03475 [Allopusillimonas ginsengisoli]